MGATLTTIDAVLKNKYGPAIMDLVNTKTVLLDYINKKKRDFKGKNYTQPKILSLGGGIGSRTGNNPTLPTAGNSITDEITANCKKLYARILIDREAKIAAKNGEQAFIDMTKLEFKAKASRFALDLNRQLYGTGGGSMGILSADPATGTTLTFTSASWTGNGAHFMEGDRIEFCANDSGEPGTIRAGDQRTISAMSPADRTLTVSAALDAALIAGDHVTLEDNTDHAGTGHELTGFASHIDDQSSTIHGISKTTYHRARGNIIDNSDAALDIDAMNQVIEAIGYSSEEMPNIIITSPYQWRILKGQLEDAKMYYAKDSHKGKFGFGALEFISEAGVIPVYSDRFCPKEKMYYPNTDAFAMIMREDFGWLDDDGTVLLREANADGYEARYGGYAELICLAENSCGLLDNLATA